jgi:hypothetical protein
MLPRTGQLGKGTLAVQRSIETLNKKEREGS